MHPLKSGQARHEGQGPCRDLSSSPGRVLVYSLYLITSLKPGEAEQHSFVRELPTSCCEYVMNKETGCLTEQLRDGDE